MARDGADRPIAFSVRAHLVGLILAIVLPLLLFSAFLVLRSARHAQDVMANTVRERTREAAATIDHELGSLRTRLFMLAGSHWLQTGDFEGFRAEAEDVARQDRLSIVLSDLTGQEIVNTAARPGAILPKTTDLAAIQRVIATGRPDVSDLTRGAVSGNPFAAINVPVLHNGQLTYVLSLNIAPLLPRFLSMLNLPPEWIVALSDRAGYTLARSRDAERFVGQMGRPAVLERFRTADEGWFPLVTRDDILAYNAFAHVRFSGWVIAVGIPEDVLYAPVRHSTWILVLSGGMIVALALALAMVIGRRIASAITSLAGYADALGRGAHIGLPATGIAETDMVAGALHQASAQLQESTRERTVLLDRTVTAQEAERKRIARELHDSLGQYLTALRLGFTAVEPHCVGDPAAHQKLSEIKGLATDLGRELNRIAWELRPLALDDLGLQRAVTQYLEEWADRSRMHIDLEINLGDRRLSQTVETALFRVLQEAVTNVVKHARADRVGVILAASDTEIRLIVEDDGRGIKLASGSDELKVGIKHLGLLGVRERLGLIGGSLEVETTDRGGTTVYVTIPLSRA